MLTFDIGFGTSIYPVVLKVRKLHKLLLDPKNLTGKTQQGHLFDGGSQSSEECPSKLIFILPKIGELLWDKTIFKGQSSSEVHHIV